MHVYSTRSVWSDYALFIISCVRVTLAIEKIHTRQELNFLRTGGGRSLQYMSAIELYCPISA